VMVASSKLPSDARSRIEKSRINKD
jgi:hypothetical protein